jgi:hypothetical protein
MRQLHVYYPKSGLFASYDIAGLNATALKAIRLIFEEARAWTHVGEDPRAITIAHAIKDYGWAIVERKEEDDWPAVFVYDRRYNGLRSYSNFLPMLMLVMSYRHTIDEIERGTTDEDDEDPEFNAKTWKEEAESKE